LLIIDFDQVPPVETGEYANYFIQQAYSQGTGGVQNATNLQSYYNAVQAAVPPGKFIVTENFGDFSANGGTPFTEANGNTLTNGTQMYSLEGMTDGIRHKEKKAGFGAFYFDRDYYSQPAFLITMSGDVSRSRTLRTRKNRNYLIKTFDTMKLAAKTYLGWTLILSLCALSCKKSDFGKWLFLLQVQK
jgi:hypothetical protein